MTAAEDPTFKDRRAQNIPDNLTKPAEGWPRWIIYMLASLVFGAIGGVIVVFAVPMLDKLKIDDVVGAISVHGIAGIWGTIAVVFSGVSSIGNQLIGTVSICLFVFILSLVIWYILDALIGIRVSEEDELTGLDTTELGMDAYPDFSKS